MYKVIMVLLAPADNYSVQVPNYAVSLSNGKFPIPKHYFVLLQAHSRNKATRVNLLSKDIYLSGHDY